MKTWVDLSIPPFPPAAPAGEELIRLKSSAPWKVQKSHHRSYAFAKLIHIPHHVHYSSRVCIMFTFKNSNLKTESGLCQTVYTVQYSYKTPEENK